MQIISATMRVLARKGYAQTMVSDVAVEAKISHGLVLFHFETKEKLLTATLRHMANEYYACWSEALAKAGPSPADRLAAIFTADFDPTIFKTDLLACWCSFWGEAQSRPLYHQECAQFDAKYEAALESICGGLILEGGYDLNPVRTARALRLLGEGLWLDMLARKNPCTPEEALRTLFSCAARFFPLHFTQEGAIKS